MISHSGIVPSREGDIQSFAELVLLNGLSEFAQNVTVGFLKVGSRSIGGVRALLNFTILKIFFIQHIIYLRNT